MLRSRIVGAAHEQIPPLRLVCDAPTVRDFESLLAMVVRAVGDGGASVAAATPELARMGATWARRRRSRADLLVAYRIPVGVLVDYVREVGDRIGSDPAETRDTVDLVLTVCTGMAAALAAGYHSAEQDRRPDGVQRRAVFVRGLLSGALDPAELADHAGALGIDPGREYIALRARPAPGTATDELARAHGFTFARSYAGGLCAVIDRDLVGFLATPPKGPVPGVCGLGPPRPLERLDESFRLASRALDTADRSGLAGIHEFGQLGLLPAVCSDSAVGEALCQQYLAPLCDSESAEEIVDTLRAYFTNGMHVGRTAERMFVHPNTVRYRICRFEELAGVNLRGNPVAAFEVLWALEHRRLRA